MPQPLFTLGKDPVPTVQEAGWAPGMVWTRVENLALTGIRSPDRPTCSQSLYRLSYRAHTFMIISSLIFRLRNVSERSCREIPNAHFTSNSFLSENRAYYDVMWNSEADPDMSQIIQ